MRNLKYLVVGCGRSGTGFLSTFINEAGKPCGHEEVFSENGPTNSDLIYESSWFAVPFLSDLSDDVKVLHTVRHPEKVIGSLYRIGMLADNPLHQIARGQYFEFLKSSIINPAGALDRIRYVNALRKFVRQHSDCFDHKTEYKRLEAYWRNWNRNIEAFAETRKRNYLRINIENFDEAKNAVLEFLDLEAPAAEDHLSKNMKPEYSREAAETEPFEDETLELMRRYGYGA